MKILPSPGELGMAGGWRGYYDFHTSCIGEWGAHTFAQCQVAIGAADTSAIHYGYVNNPTGDGMVTKFANGTKMVLSRGDKWWHGSCGVRYEGTEGWVAIADGYAKEVLRLTPELVGFRHVAARPERKVGASWRLALAQHLAIATLSHAQPQFLVGGGKAGHCVVVGGRHHHVTLDRVADKQARRAVQRSQGI